MNQIKYLDLFAGIGGFRTGLTNAGDIFLPVGWCEIDRYAQKAYRALYETEGEYFCDDATKIEPAELPDIDLICAGFPCQPFSVSGRRLGFADTRGTLFHEIVRLAEAKRPSYLLLENVPGLLNHAQGETFRTILTAIHELGYSLESKMKNESSHRTIVIPNEMVEALLEIKERQELNKKMFKGSYNRKNDDFICTDQFGELLRPNYVTQHYRLLLEKNGLRHIRFHDLRHTFASILLSNRTELIEVSKFLGHSTIATTANIYAHLDMSNKEHTASVMSDILAGMNTTKAPK